MIFILLITTSLCCAKNLNVVDTAIKGLLEYKPEFYVKKLKKHQDEKYDPETVKIVYDLESVEDCKKIGKIVLEQIFVYSTDIVFNDKCERNLDLYSREVLKSKGNTLFVYSVDNYCDLSTYSVFAYNC